MRDDVGGSTTTATTGSSVANSRFRLCVCIFFNFWSSVVIILLNKWVYVHVGFPNVTLTLVHFVVTGASVHVCRMCGVFKAKWAPFAQMLPVAATFCGFVVFTNLSLQHNTVGTYQVAKVMTTPVVVLIQIVIYQKKFSVRVMLTLIPILLGVLCVFMNQIAFNVLGTIYAVLAFLVTSFYQVWVSEKQHSLQMDAMQLLYYQAPLSATLLMMIVPILEPVTDTLAVEWTLNELAMVLASGVAAFFVNLSIYWLLGNTSPLTYNMVGQAKFCMILLCGYVLFQEPLTANQGLGMLITMLGVSAYAHFKFESDAKHRHLRFCVKCDQRMDLFHFLDCTANDMSLTDASAWRR